MRELDVVLSDWLEREWPDADADRRAAFDRLLDCEDDRLWDWFTGREVPGDPELADMVARIGALRGT